MLALLLIGAGRAEDDESLPEPVDLSGPVETTVSVPVRWRAGGLAGLSLPVDPVDVAPLGGLAVSRALPLWEGRIRPTLAAAISRTGASGTLEDPRLSAPISYDTRLLAVMLGAGLEVALLAEGLSPYLLAAPQLNLTVTTTAGESSGAALTPTREGRASAGFTAGAGILSPLGAGELMGGIHYTHLKPGGTLAGEDAARSIAPVLGYRWTGRTP
jgi:hypothetical protein